MLLKLRTNYMSPIFNGEDFKSGSIDEFLKGKAIWYKQEKRLVNIASRNLS